MAPKPTNVPSSPARKAKSVGQQPSGLPVPTAELLAAMAGSPSLLEGMALPFMEFQDQGYKIRKISA